MIASFSGNVNLLSVSEPVIRTCEHSSCFSTNVTQTTMMNVIRTIFQSSGL